MVRGLPWIVLEAVAIWGQITPHLVALVGGEVFVGIRGNPVLSQGCGDPLLLGLVSGDHVEHAALGLEKGSGEDRLRVQSPLNGAVAMIAEEG